ncbi:hypothetical protein LEN26_007525 [Aphanomyces euteiches]|nr:hypothetical protein AeMF1_004913 [Aphanomyces euteiches]KAH9132077.1 hypothetical protein LEN26_007525 [Aphanomyces euteiches]
MVRTRRIEEAKYFHIDKNSLECRLCDFKHTSKSSNVHANILRNHMRKHHPDVTPVNKPSRPMDNFVQQVDSMASIEVAYKTSMIQIKDIVSMAIASGAPLWAFEQPGYSHLVQPVEKAAKIKLNRKQVRQYVLDAALPKRNEIAIALQGQKISLKLDLCTRMRRHFLGVNIQYVDATTQSIRVETLCVKELFGSATTGAIHTLVFECLKSFGLAEHQVYSITTDNGSNVIGIHKRMNVYDFDQVDDIDSSSENDMDDGSNDDELTEVLNGVSGMRCAVHTFQFSVGYAMARDDNKHVHTKIRQIVRKCQNTAVRQLLIVKNCRIPMIDVVTRWNSTFDMIESCITSRESITEVFAANVVE